MPQVSSDRLQDTPRIKQPQARLLPVELQKKCMNTITSIDTFETPAWVGVEVVTPRQTVTLKIDNDHCCCEHYGADHSGSREFIGAEVTGVKWGPDRDGGEVSLVSHVAVLEVMTCRGTLELLVFNHHDSRYPHTIEASWEGHCDQQMI